MKKVILISFSSALFLLMGVGIFISVQGQPQAVPRKKLSDGKMGARSVSLPPKTAPLTVKGKEVQPAPQQSKIYRLRIWIKSEQEQKIVEKLGLACEGKTECVCLVTEKQVQELKKEGIEFEVERGVIKYDCIHYGEAVTIEIPFHDPDGDSMFCE